MWLHELGAQGSGPQFAIRTLAQSAGPGRTGRVPAAPLVGHTSIAGYAKSTWRSAVARAVVRPLHQTPYGPPQNANPSSLTTRTIGRTPVVGAAPATALTTHIVGPGKSNSSAANWSLGF